MRHMRVAQINSVAILVHLVLLAGIAEAADPTADLGSNAYAYQVYDNAQAGPDELHVKADRTIIANGMCGADPKDNIEITRTGNEGKDILAANATGRTAGAKVLYTVTGHWVTGGTSGSSTGTATTRNMWQAQYSTALVDILAVPHYIYADATAAVPIKFQVKNLTGSVELQSVIVEFHINGRAAFAADCSTAFAPARSLSGTIWHPDDGMGSLDDNGSTDTYVAWVPINTSTFKLNNCDVPADTTTNVFFVVKVKAKVTGVTMDPVWAISKTDDPDAHPTVFGDRDVQVIEIGVNPVEGEGEKWSVMSATTKQTAIHRRAAVQADHLWNSTWQTTYNGHTHPYKLEYSNLENAIKALDWDDCDIDVEETDSTRKINLMMDDSWELEGQTTHTVRIKAMGETIGTYFGVSYPHHSENVPTINGKGMRPDLLDGSVDVILFDGAKADVAVTDVTTDSSLGTDALSTALSVGASLATGGWATGLSIAATVIAYAGNMSSPSPEGAANAEVYFNWFKQTPDQKTATRIPRYEPYIANKGQPSPGASEHTMSESFYVIVGETRTAYVTMWAGVCKTSAGPGFGAEVSANAQFYLPGSAKWSDESVTVHSLPGGQ